MAAVGLLAMLPHIASFIFINIGGYFADYLTNKGIRLLTVRKLCNSIAFGGSGICLCIVPELESVAGIIAIMCLGNVFGGFSAGGFIVNHADIGPKHTGRLMGITNMVAALPGLVGGVLTGIILDATDSWDMVFYVVAGITFFGGIFYFLFASTDKQFD
jgi:ACS family sodium-dependent inorganic phosphate cotransporter